MINSKQYSLNGFTTDSNRHGRLHGHAHGQEGTESLEKPKMDKYDIVCPNKLSYRHVEPNIKDSLILKVEKTIA